jgi:hypothetical protein
MNYKTMVAFCIATILVTACNFNDSNNSSVANTGSEKNTEMEPVREPRYNPPVENQKSANVVPKSKKTKKYNLRKYEHVTDFYRRISGPATRLCIENNIPPAAVLAIAGLESGWNKGYVGRITGNILSLGARKGDAELPALRLPRVKSTKQLLFDSLVIAKYSKNELVWENRPESLKKDYRPSSIAGTPYQLAYFKYHPEEKAKAQVKNINDFLTIFISRNSRIAVYREARHLMDSLVNLHGKEILFDHTTSIKFVNTIGGRPNSFNFRKTWPKKVEYIINNAGLVDLTRKMYLDHKDFDEVW